MAEIRDITDNTPNADTIAECERLLAAAKSGEMRSIYAATGWSDGQTGHSWVHDPRNSRIRMVGGLEALKFDLLTDTAASVRTYRLSQLLRGEE